MAVNGKLSGTGRQDYDNILSPGHRRDHLADLDTAPKRGQSKCLGKPEEKEG